MTTMSELSWIDAAARDEVPAGEVIGVVVAGRDVALYDVAGTLYATDNLCSHGQARLCDGFLEGHEIECPMHQGRFDVRDGSATCGPAAEAIRSYPVKVEAGRVLLTFDGLLHGF